MAVVLAMTLSACGGSDGAAGAPGAPGTPGKDVDPAVVNDLTAKIKELTQAANPETCTTCHTGSTPVARTGANHQELYKQLYQDGVVKIVTGSMGIAANAATNTTTLTFQMTKKDAAGVYQPFDCTKLSANFPNGTFAIGGYWASYDAASKSFPDDLSLFPTTNSTTGAVTASTGSKAYDPATGVCTVKKIAAPTEPGNIAVMAKIAAGAPGIVTLYGTDEITGLEGALRLGKYPFAGILKVGAVDYSTAANVSGCENCHTQPYLKHAYIYGTVTDNAGAKTEFYTCKGCHYDTRTGGHRDWQLLKDDPAKYVELQKAAETCAANKTTNCDTLNEQIGIVFGTKYDYKAKLMNDVHMSHAMEFAYPQGMNNCVTCHAGKLDKALGDDKFTAETCKSCHSVDGLKAKMTAASFPHGAILDNLSGTDCTVCHKAGTGWPTLKTIHNGGYDAKIYSATGVRYSDTFKAKVESASIAGNKLTMKFSATGTLGSLSAADINPMVLVGLYGYNAKDFIVAAHGSDSDGKRNLEYVWGGNSRNPLTRFTQVGKVTAAGVTTWELTADLSLWADKIASGAIKRAEIAMLPTLKDAAGTTLGVNAPSRTFDLTKNAFDDAYFADIVKVASTAGVGGITGCNTCHDQLATTFHSADRGGNIKVCRICHEVSNVGAHLELQSRSIDSYIHAIHSFQAFDPGDINFGDPVESLEYTHHIATTFPRFGILNCESCHNAGKYNVPDQAKSMPGVLSGTDAVAGRNIGAIPAYVTGPAVRACGGCHRAQKINADDASELAVLNQHFKTFGYLVENATGVWASVVDKIMAIFK